MINRPLYVRKYHSSRLKEFDYNINNTFYDSKEFGEIIGLTDNQILRTIRDVKGIVLDKDELEELIEKSKKIEKELNKCGKENLEEKKKEYNELKEKIDSLRFHEDYIVVVMDNLKQYEYLYHNGFCINGKRFKRLSCSAGQARVSTVIFCEESIIEQVRYRLNNGRNLNKKFSPSKFNAYFGLYGSSTKLVTEPKFIIVKDYENETTFKANFVHETDYEIDDEIEVKEITQLMNRTDGMGLISPRLAEQWAKDLDLDYVPSQFCVRQSFIKGMVCVFDFHEFCKEKNNENYIVDTIYKDENGEYIKANLLDYDLILSESQAKLWDSFDSVEQYIDNCHKNNLKWGVTLCSPKEAKHMLKLNYQFIQTLDLNQKDVEDLCSQFVEWIDGVSYENKYYMLLFLLGVNNDENKIKDFLSNSDSWWIKCLLLSDEVKNDKYVRTKIRELVKKKIENACKGDIYVDGNFQVIVSDPYGFMQHVCGQKVTGLLRKNEFYSNYWNERNVTQVDAMRSPLTYLSEHVVLNLVKNEETEKWYKHCKLGIILNYHGHEVCNFGGADFDMDILATTSNKTMINGVYKDELTVVYEAPKPNKIIFNDYDLYLSDTFSFGSIIGAITNKSSNAYALIKTIEEKFGKDSKEYKIVKSRLQQCCKAQSAQIDKAKIGREVKGIPEIWIKYNKILEEDDEETIKEKEFYNSVLLDKYPYFFRYVYKDTNKKYKQYLDEYDNTCKQKFGISFKNLENLERKTKEQKDFINSFYRYCPVNLSNSSMNLLCKYIEGINFNISKKIKSVENNELYKLYKNNNLEYLEEYKKVEEHIKKFNQSNRILEMTTDSTDKDNNKVKENLYEYMGKLDIPQNIILNCLIDYFYLNNPKSNKDSLWNDYGKMIYRNLKYNTRNDDIYFPFPSKENENVDVKYLGYNYTLRKVDI